MEIEWADPPPTARKPAEQGRYAPFAAALRENKDRWAKLPVVQGDGRTEKGAAASAQNIRRGVMKDFKPKGAFETAVDGTTVYVRFVGDPEPEPEPERKDEGRPPPAEMMKDDDHHGEHSDQPPDTGPVASPAEVRAWARNNGFNVPDRGRMEAKIYEAYYAALAKQSRHVRLVTAEDDAAEV